MDVNFYETKTKLGFNFFALMLVALVAPSVFAQDLIVKGKVTTAGSGETLPGVNVVIKGTQAGAVTDADGMYALTVRDANATLVFNFIGYAKQEISVGGRTTIDVELQAATKNLDEVVVTALGIKREEKSLGYAVGEVKGSDLQRVAQENVLNGLAGRVPGVTINSTGPAGSSVSMVIRGAKSLSNDNQPLFVVDGVPINNSLNNVTQIGSDNNVDYGNAIASLNADDIETISILKGPSAAALYGSRAGNGVVMITTKKAKSSKLTVDLSTNTVFDRPFKFMDFQSQFSSGSFPYTPNNNPYPNGILRTDETNSNQVGPELNKGYSAIQWNSPTDANGNRIPTPLVAHPNNVKNFVQTGITTTNNVSIAKASDQISYRISYSNMSNHGIIPGSDLFKNTLNLSTSFKASSKIKISSNIDISRNNSDNRPAGNRGTNPLQWAYYMSPHINILDMKNYWGQGQEGLQQLTQDDGQGNWNNPYFLANAVKNSFVRDRVYGNIKGEYQITPELSFMARYMLDTYNEQRETKIPYSYTEEPRGAYGIVNMKRYERNADFLITYKKEISNFSLTASLGGNARYDFTSDVLTASHPGAGLIVPNLYTISNIAPQNLDYSSITTQKAVKSIYGLINVSYKNKIYLDFTGRNDWSSTLPPLANSYYYPSASLSVLLNQLINISPQVDLLKLRVGGASVGNDTNPYNLNNTLSNMTTWGNQVRLTQSSALLTPALKPERAASYELGTDAEFFDNRLRFSGTYYLIDNRNQILPTTIAPSAGYSSQNINAGLVRSQGVELQLGGTPIQTDDWRWDVSANWSRNRTKIVSLTSGMNVYQLWSDANGGAWTYVGQRIGDIYDAKVMTVTDKNSPYYNYPILDNTGNWQSIPASSANNRIGNFNPDFLMGFQSSLTYKAFTLNISIDWRQGGQFVSQTFRYAESDLKTQHFLNELINPNGMQGQQLRDYLVNHNLVQIHGNRFNIVGGPTSQYGGFPFTDGNGITLSDGVFNPGVIANNDGTYTENLGGAGTQYIPFYNNYPWDYMLPALFSASFIKLREASIAYSLPTTAVKKIGFQKASVSIYTRNVMLWTKAKIGIDPETAFQPSPGASKTSSFEQGIERYNVTPWVLPIGVRMGLIF